ncbi:Carbon catabolite repressor protein 4-like [Heracleum sosnowskyi]|uniref:poly(A)-specific ribonuclease n=1 Tax=Heracleum sosnowskyi TaxID=360622 RepID=A0AAD8LXF9_9APIA|nr:Carbon catabolite repressor protein 4-like [Heracleum sosnowskyi]
MGAGDFVGPKLDIEVVMSLKSKTPVVGCQINPSVRVNGYGSGQPPPHTLNFTWYRETSASAEQTTVTGVQDVCSLESQLSVPNASDINPLCHSNEMAQENHTAVSPLNAASNALPHDLSNHNLIDVNTEGITWIKLGSSRSYVPSSDDVGLTLKLECVPVDHLTGVHLSPVFVILTYPVIIFPTPCPRCMISVGSAMKSECSSSEPRSTSGINFTVLSYNILADLYASRNAHQNTPAWALAWEYRSQNLLNEIIGYNSDIICLQEVQSDHFDTYFQPEMEKHGYSSVYKKKTKEVYTANQYIMDGCATFFRNDKFKLIIKYELEFDNHLFPVVDMLQPNQRNEVCFRLMKGNIAVVLILEAVGNDTLQNGVKSRIGVANTHIHADSNFQDAKMFQVVNFIKGLEEISNSQIPLLICGDMNSLPKSDPYKFVREGKVRHISNKLRDPLGIQKHMVFCHSMRLASAYASLIQSENVERKQKAKMNIKTGEPKFTNFGSGHPRTLDYIFYTETDLKVEKLLELLDKKNVGGLALPSHLWSSDHIALMASFSYKQGYKSQQISVPRNPWEGNTPGLKLLLMEEFDNTTCTSRHCKVLS